MDIVTIVGVVAGALIILAALAVALRKGLDQWAVLALGIGALLLVGSKYATLKIGPTGIEALQAQVTKTAAAAETVATQTAQTAAAVQTTQAQIANLTRSLEARQILSPDVTKPIRTQLEASPKINAEELMRARTTLRNVRSLGATTR